MRHGLTVWKRGRSHWVIRYQAIITMDFIVFTWVLAHHVINFYRYSPFAKVYDYIQPVAAIIYAISIHSQQEQIGMVSKTLDQWYSYPFLEKKMNELKKKAEDKVKKFYYLYYNFMKLGSVAYCLMPIWRYYQTANKDPSNLLLFQCWSPFPLDTWWGFAIIYLIELLTVLNLFIIFGYIVTYLTAVAITVGYQCRLISISLQTIEERVSKTIELLDIGTTGTDWEEAKVEVMKKELRNSIIHYQTIYGLTKEVCESFKGPVTMCYYPGMFCLVLGCGRLATERENMFLIFQATFMVNAILINQYIIAFINQMITDELDILRFAVYDSPWYKMKVSCRKIVHIMQTMVLRKPSFKTVFGASANMEFFATVINASYCYLSALLSMNIKY